MLQKVLYQFAKMLSYAMCYFISLKNMRVLYYDRTSQYVSLLGALSVNPYIKVNVVNETGIDIK